MLQTDELPIQDILSFFVVFIVAAGMLALGATVAVARQSNSFEQARSKVTQVSFWADYVIVLVTVLLPASWIASIGIIQEGAPVLIPSLGTFFMTGLSVEQHAEQAVAKAGISHSD